MILASIVVFGGGELYVETWDKEEIGFKVEKGQNSNGFDYQCYIEDSVLYVDWGTFILYSATPVNV